MCVWGGNEAMLIVHPSPICLSYSIEMLGLRIVLADCENWLYLFSREMSLQIILNTRENTSRHSIKYDTENQDAQQNTTNKSRHSKDNKIK